MGDYKNILTGGLALLLFTVGTSVLVWRESAQMNLKSGIALYGDDKDAAVGIFGAGIAKSSDNYLLYLYQAKALEKRAYKKMALGMDYGEDIHKSSRDARNALSLRTDSADYFQLGNNFKLRGRVLRSAINYNVAYFYSQEPAELAQWSGLRKYQQEAAADSFVRGEVGASLMATYNQLTDFKPFPQIASPHTELLRNWFLSLPPSDWLAASSNKDKSLLVSIYKTATAEKRAEIISALDASGFTFLSEFLKAG